MNGLSKAAYGVDGDQMKRSIPITMLFQDGEDMPEICNWKWEGDAGLQIIGIIGGKHE